MKSLTAAFASSIRVPVDAAAAIEPLASSSSAKWLVPTSWVCDVPAVGAADLSPVAVSK